MMDRGSKRIAMVALLATGLAGCGSSREAAWDKGSTTSEKGATSTAAPADEGRRTQLVEKAESAWAKRDEPGKVREAIDNWEKALEMDANDPEMWAKLSRAYYFLADCHLRFEDDSSKEMGKLFEKGIDAAERSLMKRSSEFAERMRAGTKIDEALGILDEKAVPALYWRSSNMGKWADTQGIATVLSYKDEVKAIMDRVLELNETFYYGGPHRYFGAYWARIPKMAGRDLKKSRKHFEQSIRIEPNYFGTRVLYAGDYAVKSQKKELFRKQLQYVLDNDPEALPKVAPENRCEQRKAKKEMDKIDEVFE